MIIIYDELPNNVYEFIRLNLDTGDYEISYLDYDNANEYCIMWQKAGYTFIHK